MRENHNARGAYKSASIRASYNQEQFKALLSYDREKGDLTWLTDRKRATAGSVAGVLHKGTGYIQINLFSLKWQAHRVIYFMEAGEWPPHDVDHEDGNRSNNRWSNLRPATRSENLTNRVGRAKSGHKLIQEFKLKSGRSRWRFVAMRDGINYRSPTYDDLAVALEYRDAWLAEHGGPFATTRHINDTAN